VSRSQRDTAARCAEAVGVTSFMTRRKPGLATLATMLA